MLRQIQSYRRPDTVAEAWRLLDEGGASARALAGGTDLVGRCPTPVTTLVDLADLDLGHVTVDREDGTLRLGAMVTFTDLLTDAAVARHAGGVIPEVVVHVGSVLHRNSATIGGHVVRGRLSDVVPVLLALDAAVVVFDGTEHVTPLEDYYRRGRHRRPHLLLAVLLPPLAPRTGAAYERFARSGYDHALVTAAARADLDADGRVATARVVVGEVADRGRRIRDVEDALTGGRLDPDAIAAVAGRARAGLDVHGDWIVSAEYRRHLVGVLVTRVLTRVAERLEEAP